MNISKTLTDFWGDLERKTREFSSRAPWYAPLSVDYETALEVEGETLGSQPVIPSVFIVRDEILLTPAGLEYMNTPLQLEDMK